MLRAIGKSIYRGSALRQAELLLDSQSAACPATALQFMPRIFTTSLHPSNKLAPEPDDKPKPQHFHKEEKDASTNEEAKAANSGTPENMFKSRDLGHMMSYPHYDKDYLDNIKIKHLEPEKFYQKTALWAVTAMRWCFDKLTGYPNKMNENRWLLRIIFLETVAGVPGMVGGMLRHMRSLRSMNRDYGWIHTLLEEAENERMHLLTFMDMRNPSPALRGMVLLSQGVFFNAYFIFYCISPKHCHAFVGYLEEEAVRTYTHALKELEGGELKAWKDRKPSKIAQSYWGLTEESTMRDLLLAVRADEYGHSHVNHTLSKLKKEEPNPFEAGSHMFP